MRSYLPAIHSILIVLLGLFVIYTVYTNNRLQIEVSYLKSRTQTLEAKHLSTKGDDTHLGLILTFIGIGFTFFTVLTFQGVHAVTKSQVEKVDQKYTRALKIQKGYEYKFNALECELNFQMGQMLFMRSNIAPPSEDFKSYTIMSIFACQRFIQYLNKQTGGSEKTVKSLDTYIKGVINFIAFEFDKTKTKIDTTHHDTEQYLTAVKTILDYVDQEYYNKFLRVIGMIIVVED